MAVEDIANIEGATEFLTSPFGLGILLIILLFLFALAVGLYVYVSLAHIAIAKKAKHKNPGLAWIPLVGPLLISSQIAKMHWWPLLLLPLGIVFVGFPFVGLTLSTIVVVFSTLWEMKMFEAVKRPAWWAIITTVLSFVASVPSYFYEAEEVPLFFSFLTLTSVVLYLVFIGIAAWGKKK